MQVKRIDHLVITVKDVIETVNFYTRILGMKEITIQWHGGELKALRFGDQRIHVHKVGYEHQPHALKTTPGSVDLCFVTDMPIDDVVLLLKINNIAIEKQPMLIPGTLGEMVSVWFRDPDGNLIEVAKYEDG